MQLAEESLAVLADTAAHEVGHGLTFDGEQLLTAAEGVVAGRQRGADRREPLKRQWQLLPGVSHEDRAQPGKVAEAL